MEADEEQASGSESCGGGGPSKIPMFGLSKEKWLIIMIVVLLASVSWMYTMDDDRNILITHSLILQTDGLLGYRLNEDDVTHVYRYLAERNTFLVGHSGRMAELHTVYDRLAPEAHRLRHMNVPDDNHDLVGAVDNFGRITRFVTDNPERFTTRTRNLRAVHNFRILQEHYTTQRHVKP